MGLESATFLSGLVATNPIGASDPKSQGDDHLRLIKSVLLNTFPNLNAAVNPTPAQLNLLVGLTLLAQPGFAYKAADTDRNSVTLMTDDPDLKINALAAGVHQFECALYFQCLASITQGIKWGMAFSGTQDILIGNMEGEPNTVAIFAYADPSVGTINAQAATPVNNNVIYVLKMRGIIRVTVAGNLSVQWAQNVNSANVTRVGKGSYLRTQRMV